MLLTGINKIFLLGEILTIPVSRQFPDKPTEYRFTLSTKEFIPKRDFGVDHIEYHSIKVSDDCITGDKLLQPGQKVHIEGKIHTFSTVILGIKRYQTEILVSICIIFN